MKGLGTHAIGIRGVAHGPKPWDGAEAREVIAALLPAKKGGSNR